MATDYEKVCPACGSAAPLASKFCAGCGHEYRTVFHEQAEPVAVAATPGGIDVNWVPFATVIPVLAVLLWWAFRPAAPAPAPTNDVAVAAAPAPPPTYVSNILQSNLLQYGQTTDGVQRVIGKPQRIEADANGNASAQTWYYAQGAQGNAYTLQVHFNGSGQVDSWRRSSP